MILLDGKKTQEALFEDIQDRVEDTDLSLAVVLVGNNPDSEVFVERKRKFGEKLGVHVAVIYLEETASQKVVCELIHELNKDDEVGGIIVQLPLPDHIDKQMVLDHIVLSKDVDALSSMAQEVFYHSGGTEFAPATPRGVMTLLREYKIKVKNKKVAVIGQSNLVGKPLAFLLEQEDATVIRCDKSTQNIPKITKDCDIIMIAAGAPHLITKKYLDPDRKDYIIVDVGITKDGQRKIKGDVDFEKVKGQVKAITPVPGGVGPMTVLSIFENFADRVG